MPTCPSSSAAAQGAAGRLPAEIFVHQKRDALAAQAATMAARRPASRPGLLADHQPGCGGAASSTSARCDADGGGDVGEIGAQIFQHRPRIGEGRRTEVPREGRGLVGVKVADADDLHARCFGPGLHVVAREETAADQHSARGHAASPQSKPRGQTLSPPATATGP